VPQTSRFGFEYETPQTKPGITLTGDSDGTAPILAEQVDLALAGVDSRLATVENDVAIIQPQLAQDSGWIALSVAAAGGYSVSSSLYRHWGPVVMVQIVLERTGAAFPANSAGNVTDTTICTINTTEARPVNQTYTAIQATVTSGTALVNANGTVVIADMHSTSVINTNDLVRIATMYFVSTFN
jgi:hypothetical protein